MTDFYSGDYETPDGLLRKMRPWFSLIESAAHVELEVVQVPLDGFKLVARWKSGKEYRRHYSTSFVIENKKTRACDHARAFLREILERRGVA